MRCDELTRLISDTQPFAFPPNELIQAYAEAEGLKRNVLNAYLTLIDRLMT